MLKVDKHIEIVRSSKTWLVSMGQASSEAILDVLKMKYTRVGISIVNNIDDLNKLVELKPDLVFLGMKYIDIVDLGTPDKIWISEHLDSHNIAYTGSSHRAIRFEQDKSLAKRQILDSGLSTSPFVVVKKNTELALGNALTSGLNFPLFVKPLNKGGGQGIDSNSVVYSQEELSYKIKSISLLQKSDSLVENFLVGREFSISIIKDELNGHLIAMPLELIAEPDEKGSRILSKKVKSEDAEMVLLVRDSALNKLVGDFGIQIFKAINARDYGRIDVRLDRLGVPQFLEANLIPSLINNYGSFPKACNLNLKISYRMMIYKIVNLAILRSSVKNNTELVNDNIVDYSINLASNIYGLA
jgi:D-alanine-D-alanine ligase